MSTDARDPWPPELLAKSRILTFRGYWYEPGPPEALYYSETGDRVTRAELETMDEATIRARLPPVAHTGLAIGFRR